MRPPELNALLTVAIMAFVVPILTLALRRWVRIPIVVGEILAGIGLGPHGVSLIPHAPGPWLEFLSMFGLAFLMYTSGLSMDFAAIRRATRRHSLKRLVESRNPLRMALWLFVASLVLSLVAAVILTAVGLVDSPWLLALMFSTSAVGLIPPLLRESGHNNTNFGLTLLLSGTLAGFGSMMLVTLVAPLYGGSVESRLLLLPLLVVVLSLLVLALGRMQVTFARFRRLLRRLANTTAQLQVRGSFVLMLLFMLMAVTSGNEMMLGAFLGGVMASWLSDEEQPILTIKLDAIGYGFFIPVYFIMLGAKLDLSILAASTKGMLLVPILLVAALAVKVVPAALFLRRTEVSLRDAIAGGFLLAARLNVLVVTAEMAFQVGAIDEAVRSALVLVAIVTATVPPMLFLRLLPSRQKEVQNLNLTPFLDFLLGTTWGQAEQIRVREEEISGHSTLCGKTLAESGIRETTGATIIGIRRPDGRYLTNPAPDVQLLEGDIVLASGTDEALELLHWLIWW